MMRNIAGMAAAFVLVALPAVFAAFCGACGSALPEASRFCNSCGAAQQEAPARTGSREWQTLPAKRQTAPGAVSERQFAQIIRPLEEYGHDLRITNLGSPLVPTLIQRTLIPGHETIKKNLAQRRLTLSPAQNRILSLYGEHYSSIMAWATTLGMERELLFPRIPQALCLQAFLLAHPDDEGLAALKAFEAVFGKEQQNLSQRIENLEKDAGYENPGIAYQVRRYDQRAVSDSFTFSLLMSPRNRKIGDRMQVFDASGGPLGQLVFAEEKEGMRLYSGTMSRKRFDALKSRQVQVKYVAKSTFSTSWKKETLRLHLLSCLKPGEPIEYAYEALHGTAPDAVRMRFLQGIGKY